MTCKDCLHYEACKSLLEAMGYTVDGDGENADKRCDTFADRSRYVVREKGEWLDSHGRPVPFDDKDNEPTDSCHCSLCGEWLVASDEYAVKGSFCPNCGADMRKEKPEA